MKDLNEWENIPDNYDDFVGFVYIIEELDTGMKYIGIKKFWRIAKLKALKGRTKKEKARRAKLKGRRRHVKKETDWRTYNSSSTILQEKMEENPSNFRKTIISCHSSVSELKAKEAFMQLTAYFNGDWDEYYNVMVNLRINLR